MSGNNQIIFALLKEQKKYKSDKKLISGNKGPTFGIIFKKVWYLDQSLIKQTYPFPFPPFIVSSVLNQGWHF